MNHEFVFSQHLNVGFFPFNMSLCFCFRNRHNTKNAVICNAVKKPSSFMPSNAIVTSPIY